MQQITGIVQNVDGQNVKYSVSVGVYDTAGSIGQTTLAYGGSQYAVGDTGNIGNHGGTYQVLTVAGAVLAITGVSQGSKTFTVAGDQTVHFPDTGTFAVSGSTGNDGTYTVSSISVATDTTITVVESIPDATVDGSITSAYGPVTSFEVTDNGSGYVAGGEAYGTTTGGAQAGLGSDLEIQVDSVQSSSLSSIYSDNQSTAAPNPFNTNENGYYSFYVSEGATYYLVVLNPDDSQNYALQDVTLASTGGGGSGNLSGTLTANQVPVASGTNTLIDSAISYFPSTNLTEIVASPATGSVQGTAIASEYNDVAGGGSVTGLDVFSGNETTQVSGAVVGVNITATGNDGGGSSSSSVGIQLGASGVNGASAGNNFAIQIGNMSNATDYAIQTGTGLVSFGGATSAPLFLTATNCSSSTSPAVCVAAAAGSVAVPTGASPTLTVNTTAVTANSQILLTIDESLGTKLGVTCNTTLATLVQPVVTARTAATSFTMQINATLAANPACVSYMIIN